MINSKRLHSSLLVYSLLLALFTSLLILNRSEVVKAAEITQADITYTLDYQDEQGSWHNITSAGGATVGYISREYRMRFRFRLPETMQLGQPYDINFTLNHQSSDIRGINFTVADYNGTILSGSSCTYDSLSTQSNNSLTRTTFNIYGFKCNTSAWVTLSFSYYSDSAPHPSTAGAGVISAGIVGFSITDSSVDSILIKWQQSLSVQINDMISAMDSVSDSIEHEETSILGGLVDLGSDILGGLGDLGSDLLGGIGDLGSDILGGLGDLGTDLLDGIDGAISSISGFFDSLASTLTSALSSLGTSILNGLTSLGNFIINGLKSLFIPESDDLEDFLAEFKTDIMEENEMFGGVVGIFTDLFDEFSNGEIQDTIHIPEFSFVVNGTTVSVGNWDMPLFPTFPGSPVILNYVRLFTSVMLGLWLLNMIYANLMYTLGISSRKEAEQ